MVPFQSELDSIVRDVRGVTGVILVDFEGEAVISASSGISTYDLKVVGAYGGIFLEQLRRITGGTGNGTPISFSLDGSGCRILCTGLKDGYHLVLVANSMSPMAIAAERLRICADRLIHEL